MHGFAQAILRAATLKYKLCGEDGFVQIILRAATLKYKLQFKLAVIKCPCTLTQSQAVPAQTQQQQLSNREATRIPNFRHWNEWALL